MQCIEATSSYRETRGQTRAPFCEIRTDDEDGAHVIRIRGELDLTDCHRLDRALMDAEHTEAALVLVDCDELEFIDAAGLHSLFAASRRAADNGNRLRITPGGKGVARMFELSGLDAVLPLLGTRDAA